ncbi:uncharacterized protein LOC114269754 [Camellia sinensis]|uniref:uncharacterized protein LOC114269754 n=1 Tax=Camellia sinensis TaxID=4442 RepID=UPI00103566D3|nr:uncharacterized protein LOC114269754 [Camellia sinensis]
MQDEHYNEALKVKHWMVDHHTSFVKPRMVTNNALIQDFDGTLVLVVDFPQEGPNTSDYAIFICFIIRQYVHRVEIDNTIDGLTQSVLRAMMVKMFMINPTRGRLRDCWVVRCLLLCGNLGWIHKRALNLWCFYNFRACAAQ